MKTRRQDRHARKDAGRDGRRRLGREIRRRRKRRQEEVHRRQIVEVGLVVGVARDDDDVGHLDGDVDGVGREAEEVEGEDVGVAVDGSEGVTGSERVVAPRGRIGEDGSAQVGDDGVVATAGVDDAALDDNLARDVVSVSKLAWSGEREDLRGREGVSLGVSLPCRIRRRLTGTKSSTATLSQAESASLLAHSSNLRLMISVLRGEKGG